MRETAVGRWTPVVLCVVNVAGAVATAVAVDATELLHLAVLPLPAVVLYLWRTREGRR